ncbi:XorII very short patch repair endonuclease [Skermanella stibiiresistens SB22]|uniref:Very short patch repair endonuclease n=1 Tax=Skermanella stibiiresistens SB22 TaxID=1385369 RepID=W9H382_9PROT|nr:very short patch repair endonuclease [Skermanella stibiiresistens]EWY40534.1 XorII very short patch repair endonuclease [Skermanella stibiiresistens SB22]
MSEIPVDPARSALMAKIGPRDTRPEMRVRKLAHAMGLRYRLHRRDLPGKPDMVFPSRRVALFVHGCFWHRHPGCKANRLPKTRVDFWEAKFQGNVERDARVTAELERRGWTVLVIWECETRDEDHLRAVLSAIRSRPPASSQDPGFGQERAEAFTSAP